MENKNTLILGIGNTLLSDEGVGIRVLDYLREHHPDLPDADLLDGGTLSFTLLPYIEDAANLVVIDAAELGAAPGTVEVFQDVAMDRFAGRPRRSVHEVSLADLLDICHLTGTLPHRRALVTVQPQHIDWGSQLSRPVAAALPGIARRVADFARLWAATGSKEMVADIASAVPGRVGEG